MAFNWDASPLQEDLASQTLMSFLYLMMQGIYGALGQHVFFVLNTGNSTLPTQHFVMCLSTSELIRSCWPSNGITLW
jgi:hypothetical protein